jgi:hypothetical protein
MPPPDRAADDQIRFRRACHQLILVVHQLEGQHLQPNRSGKR